MAAEANEETGETSSGRARTPLTMPPSCTACLFFTSPAWRHRVPSLPS